MVENVNVVNSDDEEFKKNLAHYRQVMGYLAANVPIGVLCLPKVIENALIKEGCVRVYDLLARDLKGIKGIGDERLNILTARLDEFFTVGI
jgi:hypothetical protein